MTFRVGMAGIFFPPGDFLSGGLGLRDLSTNHRELQVAESFLSLWDEPREVGIFFYYGMAFTP